MDKEIEMEKNHVVVVRFFENDGEYGDTKLKEYGPYSKEEAEQLASQLTETGRQLRGGVFPTFFAEASALMLEPKGAEEILAFIKSEEEKQNGPLPTLAEIKEAKEYQRLKKLRGPRNPSKPRW